MSNELTQEELDEWMRLASSKTHKACGMYMMLDVKPETLLSFISMARGYLDRKMCDDCGKKPAVNHTCYRCGLPQPANDGHY